MKEPCTEYLKRAHVPKINTPESFSIEKYIEKDASRAKPRQPHGAQETTKN